MDTKVTRNLAVLFFSGIIGGVVVYSVAPWLWWLGVIVGGAVGYVANDFSGFLAGAKKARQFSAGEWTEERKIAVGLGSVFLRIASVAMWAVGIVLIARAGCTATESLLGWEVSQESRETTNSIAIMVDIILIMVITFYNHDNGNPLLPPLKQHPVLYLVGPILFFLYLPILGIGGLIVCQVAAIIGLAVLLLAVALVELCILLLLAAILLSFGYNIVCSILKFVHSNERLACLAFTAGGITIAHCLTSSVWVVLLSGLFSAGLGWLDYKLVSLWQKRNKPVLCA